MEHRELTDQGSPGRRLLANRPVMLLWGGESIPYFGDAFFNLAVVWTVYASTGSALQTALIQVVWQLPTRPDTTACLDQLMV